MHVEAKFLLAIEATKSLEQMNLNRRLDERANLQIGMSVDLPGFFIFFFFYLARQWDDVDFALGLQLVKENPLL